VRRARGNEFVMMRSEPMSDGMPEVLSNALTGSSVTKKDEAAVKSHAGTDPSKEEQIRLVKKEQTSRPGPQSAAGTAEL
jgi:hypothetical protein